MLQIVVDVREHTLIEKLNGLAAESKSDITICVETLLLGDVLLRKCPGAALLSLIHI